MHASFECWIRIRVRRVDLCFSSFVVVESSSYMMAFLINVLRQYGIGCPRRCSNFVAAQMFYECILRFLLPLQGHQLMSYLTFCVVFVNSSESIGRGLTRASLLLDELSCHVSTTSTLHLLHDDRVPVSEYTRCCLTRRSFVSFSLILNVEPAAESVFALLSARGFLQHFTTSLNAVGGSW